GGASAMLPEVEDDPELADSALPAQRMKKAKGKGKGSTNHHRQAAIAENGEFFDLDAISSTGDDDVLQTATKRDRFRKTASPPAKLLVEDAGNDSTSKPPGRPRQYARSE